MKKPSRKGARPKTLEVVGDDFAATRARIRKIEAKALRKLSATSDQAKAMLEQALAAAKRAFESLKGPKAAPVRKSKLRTPKRK